MRRSLFIVFLVWFFSPAFAQKFTTEKGTITFFSDAAIEDIMATNTVIGSLFNVSTSEIVFIAKIRDFVFNKSLMREHFNEKYLESEKFPKATFQGKVSGYTHGSSSEQNVRASGKLTIHGVTRTIDVPGSLQLVNDKLILKSKFRIKLAEYDIKIPTIVWQNIAEDVEVTVDLIYKPV